MSSVCSCVCVSALVRPPRFLPIIPPPVFFFFFHRYNLGCKRVVRHESSPPVRSAGHRNGGQRRYCSEGGVAASASPLGSRQTGTQGDATPMKVQLPSAAPPLPSPILTPPPSSPLVDELILNQMVGDDVTRSYIMTSMRNHVNNKLKPGQLCAYMYIFILYMYDKIYYI